MTTTVNPWRSLADVLGIPAPRALPVANTVDLVEVDGVWTDSASPTSPRYRDAQGLVAGASMNHPVNPRIARYPQVENAGSR